LAWIELYNLHPASLPLPGSREFLSPVQDVIGLVKIADILAHQPFEMPFIEYDHNESQRASSGNVHYGATHIEAQLCEGQEVIVVGGGNSAGQAAVFLSQTARKVYMLVRGADLSESMSRYLIQRITGNPSIELLSNSEICGLEGENNLEEVSWINKQTGQVRSVPAHHLFIMTGASPNTNWLRGSVALEEKGSILTGRDLPLAIDPIGIPGRFRARL
jgi:thioredoxin reductase (NADPH)